jgi:hypothetical protein
MAVNTCPPGDALHCLVSVAQNEGMAGLYTGLGFRMVYAALFTAVGFASFEYSKQLLGLKAPDEGARRKAAPAKGQK